jgi:polysaccharide biosynthesis/export protein
MQEKAMFRRGKLCTVFLLMSFVAPAWAQEEANKQAPTDAQKATDTGDTVKKAATDDPNYIIGPQDVVDISVWKEPELSRSVPVRPDGKITLPLLNDVQAAGLTPGQLAAEITEGLKKFETAPQVTVIVATMKSQRFYILGEAGHPGAYELLPNMTVLQAISSGGGFTQYAHVKKIYILRVVNGKPVKYPFNYKAVVAGKSTEQNIILKSGDTIVIP